MSSAEALDGEEIVQPIGKLQLAQEEAEGQSSSEDEGVFLSNRPAQDATPDDAPDKSLDELAPQDTSAKTSQPQMIIDDSDDDDVNISLSMGRRKPAMFLSDEEDDDGEGPQVTTTKKFLTSDDDDDDEEEENKSGKTKKKRIVQRVDSDDENDDEDDMLYKAFSSAQDNSEKPKTVFKYNSDLFDTEELSDEEQGDSGTHSPTEYGGPKEGRGTTPDTGKQKSKKGGRAKVPSLKEKEATVRKIHSESQRMVRESEVSLPYHRPKQRTLAEFLNRRKKTMLPQRPKGSSLKMSMRNPENLRLLAERDKDVEEFYKSESDEDDQDDEEWKPENETRSRETSPAREVEAKVNTGEADGESKAVPEASEASPEDMDELPDLVSGVASTAPEAMEVHVLEGTEASAQAINEASTKSSAEASVGVITEPCTTREAIEVLMLKEMEASTKPRAEVITEPSTTPEAMEVPVLQETEASTTAEANVEVITEPSTTREVMEVPMLEETESSTKPSAEASLIPVEEEDSGHTNPDDQVKEAEISGTPKFSLLASRLPGLNLGKLLQTTPKLSLGGEEGFIDLEEECQTPNNASEFINLMDRFVRHSNTKRKPVEKQQVNLGIVSKEKDGEGAEKLVASNLVVTLDGKDEEVGECAPGSRLVILKSALKAKIQERREEQRMRKVKEKQFLETEQVIEDYQDDCELPDEEAELTDRSDTEYETESEPEENDVDMTDTKRKKSKYFNDEAEEDEMEGDENDDDDDGGGEGEDDVDDNDDNHGEDDDEDDDERPEDDDGASNDTVEMPGTQRRIMFHHDDSDEDDGGEETERGETLKLQLEETQDVHTARDSKLHRTNTEDLFASQHGRKGSMDAVDRDVSVTSMDSSFELFGSVIPGHQPGGGMRHSTTVRPSDSDGEPAFLTPFTKATRSTSFSSSKDRGDLNLPIEDSQELFNTTSVPAPSSPSVDLSLHLTPLKDSQFPQDTQKDSMAALRLDFRGIDCSQDKDDLMGICSGQFGTAPSTQMQDLCEDDSLAPTQDIGELMGLCSGHFNNNKANEKSASLDPTCPAPATPDISELVTTESNTEEDLLGLCTARFTSQAVDEEKSSTRNTAGQAESEPEDKVGEEEEEEASHKMVIFSSDDEEAITLQSRIKRRQKRKRVMELSDDEDAQHQVQYDEDENEITRTSFSGFKDKRKGMIRADFLEAEAELSGSDNNSADEDEMEEDDYLMEEEGDQEHYDENELRNQVGRAHLKTVLDSDKREIRLLQEMYLEDGELHGEGRQRQFRWKNLNNSVDDSEKRVISDNEEENEEEEEDAEWRKQRFEREKYLEEQKQKAKDDWSEEDMFKMKLRTVVRSSSSASESPAAATATTMQPLKTATPVTLLPSQPRVSTPRSLSILSKKTSGSFLSRDKETLARIAQITKDVGGVVGGAKQAGNFVFKQLSAEEAQASSSRLKRTQSLPSTKKARLDRSFFTMDASKKASSIFNYF